jgi:cell division protein FtsZ
MEVVAQKTGTDNAPIVDVHQLRRAGGAGGERSGAAAPRSAEAMAASGVDKYDIPAFLRKQAD